MSVQETFRVMTYGIRRRVCLWLQRGEGFPKNRVAMMCRHSELADWKHLQRPDGHTCQTYPAAERLGLKMPPHEYFPNGAAAWGVGAGWVVIVAPWFCDQEPCANQEETK